MLSQMSQNPSLSFLICGRVAGTREQLSLAQDLAATIERRHRRHLFIPRYWQQGTVGAYKRACLVHIREHRWYISESTVGAYKRAHLVRIRKHGWYLVRIREHIWYIRLLLRGFLFRAGGCIGTIVGVLLFPHGPLTKAPLILVAPIGHDPASNPLDYANNVHDKSPGCIVPWKFLVGQNL